MAFIFILILFRHLACEPNSVSAKLSASITLIETIRKQHVSNFPSVPHWEVSVLESESGDRIELVQHHRTKMFLKFGSI